MKNKFKLLVAVLFCVGAAEAQSQILQITELDEDGNEIAIGTGISKTDINSYLDISINKDRLSASQPESAALNRQLRRVERLQLTLAEGLETMSNLRQAYEESLEQNDRQIYQDALQEQAAITIQVLDLLRALNMNRALQRFNEALQENLSVMEQYTIFFEIVEDEYTAIQREVQGIIDREGQFYVLGAWLIHGGESRPLSLSGFDTYSEREFYRVDRFRDVFVNLSNAHENMIHQFSEGDQQRTFNSATEELVSSASRKIEIISDNVQACVTNFRFESRRLISAQEAELMSLRDELISEFEVLTNTFQNVIERVNSVSNLMEGISAVHGISRELQPIENQGQSMLQTLRGFADSTAASLQGADLQMMNEVLESCINQVSPVTDMALLVDAFRGSGEANLKALEFGDEVIRHSLVNMPDQTSLPLQRTGFREAGDMVVVKLAHGRSDEAPRDMAVRQMQLERVLPYLRLVPGIIYARPTSEREIGVRGQFHIAPSYSVLLKFGSRRSSIINRLIQPGVGINLSALDMSNDRTPELGIALVGSAVKDYLMVGYGYNVNVQKGFFAFGLRLPLASMTLQGVLDN